MHEYLANGQVTARWFVDEATGEAREAASARAPKAWPMAQPAQEFARSVVEQARNGDTPAPGSDGRWTEWHFYASDDDHSTDWANHCYALMLVCSGFGDDPVAAWNEALTEGRVPPEYDLGEPPTVAIQAENERSVALTPAEPPRR